MSVAEKAVIPMHCVGRIRGGYLLEYCHTFVPASGVLRRGCPNVVHAFEKNYMFETRLMGGVVSVPADEARAKAALEDAIAACGFVHADLRQMLIFHSSCEIIGQSVER